MHVRAPTKDKTVKTTGNSEDMTIPKLNQVYCLIYAYLMIWKRNKFTISGNYEYDVTNSSLILSE